MTEIKFELCLLTIYSIFSLFACINSNDGHWHSSIGFRHINYTPPLELSGEMPPNGEMPSISWKYRFCYREEQPWRWRLQLPAQYWTQVALSQ